MSQHNHQSHQHFVPRVYLQNFAKKEGNKSFIEAYNKRTNNPPSSKSIRDICVKKDFYTLKPGEGLRDLSLEKFYHKKIENIYPSVYKALTDPTVITVDPATHEYMVFTIYSFLIRTVAFNKLLRAEFNSNIQNFKFGNEIVIEIFNVQLRLPKRYDEDIKTGKIDFICHLVSLEMLKHLVICKSTSPICVYKIDDYELVTSDNPVTVYDPHNTVISIDNKEFITKFAIDRKHYVQILPTSAGISNGYISRSNRDKWFARALNDDTHANADMWVLGHESFLQNHLDFQLHQEDFQDEIAALEEIRRVQLNESIRLEQILSSYGTLSGETAKQVARMTAMKEFENDETVKRLGLILRNSGFSV